MRVCVILALILSPFIYVFASEEYCEEIQALTEDINSYPGYLCPIELRNQRGLFLFLSTEYDAAIEDFNDVIERLENKAVGNCSLYASALWGRFLTYAFSDIVDQSLKDLFLIRRLFMDGEYNCKGENLCTIVKFDRAFSVLKIAEFVDPGERLTPEQCKQRVKGTALAMKALCLKIPNAAIRFSTEVFISELEEKAYTCCEREHWTECLSPIIDAWQYLKQCMDKGVRYAPYVLFPSSNSQPIEMEKTMEGIVNV